MKTASFRYVVIWATFSAIALVTVQTIVIRNEVLHNRAELLINRDKLAKDIAERAADRWTGTDQKNYAETIEQRLRALESRK